MGGNVGVIVKKQDGTQLAMDRWTNVMPSHFNTPELYLGDTKKWFNQFIESWNEMKIDYESNKDTGNFTQNMTSVYFPHEYACPSEYGIIAIDLQTKKIYSAQDYCSIGNPGFYQFWSNTNQEKESLMNLKQFWDNKIITKMSYYKDNKEQFIDLSTLSWEDIKIFLDEVSEMIPSFAREALNIQQKPYTHPLLAHYDRGTFTPWSCHFIIESDWQIMHIPDRCIGVLKVKEALDKDGFVFTEADNNAWKEYVSYRWEECEEEDLKNDEQYKQFVPLYEKVFNTTWTLP